MVEKDRTLTLTSKDKWCTINTCLYPHVDIFKKSFKRLCSMIRCHSRLTGDPSTSFEGRRPNRCTLCSAHYRQDHQTTNTATRPTCPNHNLNLNCCSNLNLIKLLILASFMKRWKSLNLLHWIT